MINTEAVPAVEATLWTLAAFSVATWALIFIKLTQHQRVRARNRRFDTRPRSAVENRLD